MCRHSHQKKMDMLLKMRTLTLSCLPFVLRAVFAFQRNQIHFFQREIPVLWQRFGCYTSLFCHLKKDSHFEKQLLNLTVCPFPSYAFYIKATSHACTYTLQSTFTCKVEIQMISLVQIFFSCHIKKCVVTTLDQIIYITKFPCGFDIASI